MRRMLVIAATFAFVPSAVCAQHGPAYPEPGAGRGPAYPKTVSPTATNPTHRIVQKPEYTDPNESASPPVAGWHTWLLGAGGAVRGMDIQCDQGVGACNGNGTTTKIIRTDTYGAYLCNPAVASIGIGCATSATGQWQQLLSTATMPGAGILSWATTTPGVYDIKIAPSNTSIFYMIFNGKVYRSAMPGGSWVDLGLAQDTTADPNANAATYNSKLAIDPANPNALIACTPTAGCSFTTNANLGASATWTAIPSSSIAAGNRLFGYLVAYDPSTTSSGSTPGIFVFSYGQGVYHTSKGAGGTWTKQTGSSGTMPTNFTNMIVDVAGNLFVVDNSYSSTGLGLGALNKYVLSTTTWTQPLPSSDMIQSIAVNPNAPTRVYASVSGATSALYVSTNTGGSFGSATSVNNTTSGGVPWIGPVFVAESNALFQNMMIFDPAQTNVLYAPNGLGVATTTPPTKTGAASITWADQSPAIEQIVANWIVSPNTPGSLPVMAGWDQGIFTNATPLTSYATTNPAGGNNAAHTAWSVDWCSSSPSTVVALVTNPGVDNSGILSAGVYTPFASRVVTAGANAPGISIACSTPLKICAVGGDSAAPANNIVCTVDGGSTWTRASYTGTAPNTSGGNGICSGWGVYFTQRQSLIADRGNGNFYAYNAGNSVVGGSPPCVVAAAGVWRWTGSGNWANALPGQFDGGATNNSQMRAVPGQSGDFFYTSGNQGTKTAQPLAYPLRECIDVAGALTCSSVANTKEIWSVGFGKAALGKTYPAVYVVGWISQNAGVTYTFGEWESDDHCVTWTNIGTFPLNSFDQITVIEGDNNVYGRAYVGFHGSGFAQDN